MSKQKLRQLPVRVRQTLHGDGESTNVRTVLCPTHGHAQALSLCGECEHCDHIGEGARGELKVTCQPEAPLPTMRWASMLHHILPSAGDRVPIADVMSRHVICVTRDVSVEALTGTFVDRGISAAPVVDEAGYPIGIVSKTDLVRERWESADSESSDGADAEVLPDGMHVAKVARALVSDIMMPLAFTLREDEPLSRAAAVMDFERVHHLPVVAADGRVVGILSSLDFVRWVAKQSAFLDVA
jgi:CBS domain-containing protein